MQSDAKPTKFGFNTEFPFDKTILKSITSQFNTPVYVYRENTIQLRAKYLQQLFKNLPVKWLYAMKANDNPHILKIFSDLGFGFDTVSFEEATLAKRLVAPSNIFYTENNMSDVEMDEAMKANIVLNIGSFSRLKKFAEAGGKKCSIRLVPEIGDGLHQRVTTGHKESKFGIDIALLDEIIALENRTGLQVQGVHMHIGSGIKRPENMINAMKRLVEMAKGFRYLKSINFGGGFPIAYHEGDHGFDVAAFGEEATLFLEEDLKNRPDDFSYMFEPGRWLVAQSGCLLTKVTAVKKAGSLTYLGTDTGFNHLARPVLYDAEHRVISLEVQNERSNTHSYTVAGNICESSDILAKNVLLPETVEGDVLALADTGAYGMTMASIYNRRLFPNEVLITSDNSFKAIRKRPSVEEHINTFLRETLFEQ
jgi:diaminopimelate decarboxylase